MDRRNGRAHYLSDEYYEDLKRACRLNNLWALGFAYIAGPLVVAIEVLSVWKTVRADWRKISHWYSRYNCPLPSTGFNSVLRCAPSENPQWMGSTGLSWSWLPTTVITLGIVACTLVMTYRKLREFNSRARDYTEVLALVIEARLTASVTRRSAVGDARGSALISNEVEEGACA
jgi:hypothetical protein